MMQQLDIHASRRNGMPRIQRTADAGRAFEPLILYFTMNDSRKGFSFLLGILPTAWIYSVDSETKARG